MPKMREEAFVAPTGWRVSLDFCGTRLVERDFRGEESFSVGEHTEASLVLPGLGGAEGRAFLTQGDWLLYVEGLAGDVILSGEKRRFADFMVDGAVRLRPGDSARLRLIDRPDIVLKLRMEPPLEVGWGVRLGLRELSQQLALGGGLAAILALLVQTPEPVPEVEMESDPEATESAFERVLFASLAEIELPPPRPRPVYEAPIVLPEAAPKAAAVIAPEPEELPQGEGAGTVIAAEEDEVAPVAEEGEAAGLGAGDEAELGLLIGTSDAAMIATLSAADEPEGEALLGILGAVDEGELGDLFADNQLDQLDQLDMVMEGSTVDGERGAGVDLGTVLGVVSVDGGATADELIKTRRVEDEDVSAGAPVVGGVLLPSVLDDPDELVPEESREASPTTPAGKVETVEPREGASGDNSHSASGAKGGVSVALGLPGTSRTIAPIVCEDPKRTQKSQVDVVFVVDVSTTMGFMVDGIEQGILSIDASLHGLAKDPRYGLVVFVDDVEVANGGLAFTSVDELRAELRRWHAFTSSNRQIRTDTRNTDWPENSLDALHAAAVDFAWRPSSTTARLVVHATDDDFGEVPAIQSGVPIQHTYAETVSALRTNQIRVSSFGARLGGECECLDVTRGILSPFEGSPSIPAATGGAAFDIDEVSSGHLTLNAAIEATLGQAVCTSYPLIPKPPTAFGVIDR